MGQQARGGGGGKNGTAGQIRHGDVSFGFRI